MKPVLLLIPGMLNDGRVWTPVAERLAGVADVRVADVSHQDSIAGMRRDAWALVADVPAGVPLVIAGFSMGGYVLQDMLAHPARPVNGLLFLDTSAQPDTEQSLRGRDKTLAAIEADYPRFVDGVLGFNTHSASEALRSELRQMMLDLGAETARRQVRAIMGRQDHRSLLPAITVPTAVLCGRHDRVTPPALSEALAQSVPGAQLQLVDDAGHMLPREQPQAVAVALRTLITTCQ